MTRPLVVSLALHVLIIVGSFVSWQWQSRPVGPIAVEFVTEVAVDAPPPEAEPEAAPAPAPAPEPAPAPAPEPTPAPEPAPPPPPEPEAPTPEPAPTPQPPQQALQPPLPPSLVTVEEGEGQPQHDFTSVLKTVETLQAQRAPREPPEETVEASKPVRPPQGLLEDSVLSPDELARIRRQIAQCWSVPAGARDARGLVVEVEISVGPDRRVLNAQLVGTLKDDPFWRTAAESAVRAVLNPRCNPLDLPVDKYHLWRTIIFTFNPEEMFG